MANPEFKKTILIGLGGAGQLMLLHVKRLLLDTYDAIPPSIKMLSLDTDSAPVTLQSGLSDKVYGFEADEYFHLAVPDPQDPQTRAALARLQAPLQKLAARPNRAALAEA